MDAAAGAPRDGFTASPRRLPESGDTTRAQTAQRQPRSRGECQSSTISNDDFDAPQSGQIQSSGTSAQAVPGAMPDSG